MAYKGIVTPLINVREHPNADRINLATVAGHQVVVDKTKKDGEIGIFFPADGKLSEQMLLENKLYREHPGTGEKMGGFFEKHGRVRIQNFRGEKSQGFWIPLKSLEWTGADINSLKKGDLIDVLNGHVICEKYVPPRTAKAAGNKKKNRRSMEREFPLFHKHRDTDQLAYYIDKIPWFATLIITEKLHGTSGRSSNSLRTKNLRWYHKLFGIEPKSKWEYVTGSRNVVMNFDKSDKDYYKNTTFREIVHNIIKEIGLKKGETVYYEIVGYTDTGKTIMGRQKVLDKGMKKRFGPEMVYSYECNYDDAEKPTFDFYVYRMSMTNVDGEEQDYSWDQVKERCYELGLKHVPEVDRINFVGFDEKSKLIDYIENLEVLDEVSSIDSSHISEGVVVMVEHPKMFKYLKHKGYEFLRMEQGEKDDNKIDLEEIS